MAGVPTGRGCDACRKQKKKCDLAQPACSRCTRLRIPCIGCGEKRYKFKQENPAHPEPMKAQPAQTAPTSAPVAPPTSALRRVPSNGLMRGTAAYIAVLDISDLRYDISGCGGFLKDIPRRLGRNRALDASVGALTAVFSILYTQEPTRDMLAAYVYALKCLRVTLADRGWIGETNDSPVGHSEAIFHILNCIALNHWKGHFENQLFVTLCVSVLPESVYNPNIKPGPWFRRIVDNFAPHGTTSSKNGGPGPAMCILTLTRLVEFVREPRGDVGDILIGYDVMLQETTKARENLQRMSEGNHSALLLAGVDMERIRLLCQAQFAVLLAATMLVNNLLSVLIPSNTELPKQVESFPDELLDLNERTAKYRPIGAGFIPTCLLMACVATTNLSHLAKMTHALAEYGDNPVQSKWEYWAAETRSRFQDLRFRMASIHLEESLA